MKWEVLYKDFTKITSEDCNWTDLPVDDVIIIWVIFPSGSRMQLSGWDYYCLRNIPNGISAYMWKDKDAVDINGNPMFDPYAGYYSYREFFNDNSGNSISYHPVRKMPKQGHTLKGIWVSDRTARKMGI